MNRVDFNRLQMDLACKLREGEISADDALDQLDAAFTKLTDRMNAKVDELETEVQGYWARVWAWLKGLFA